MRTDALDLAKFQARNKLTPRSWSCLLWAFLDPKTSFFASLDVVRDERSNVKADYGKFVTSLPGVFAAGDIRRGQSLVVWAINEGRGAARECDRFLMGETTLP